MKLDNPFYAGMAALAIWAFLSYTSSLVFGTAMNDGNFCVEKHGQTTARDMCIKATVAIQWATLILPILFGLLVYKLLLRREGIKVKLWIIKN